MMLSSFGSVAKSFYLKISSVWDWWSTRPVSQTEIGRKNFSKVASTNFLPSSKVTWHKTVGQTSKITVILSSKNWFLPAPTGNGGWDSFWKFLTFNATWPWPWPWIRVMSGLSLETCLSNLKSVALTVLELLVFNSQKIRVSCDPAHAPHFKEF